MESTCNTCGTTNPAEAKFCMSCGAQLERRCPSCGTPAPPQAKFCMSCGSALDPAAAPAAQAPPPAPPAAATAAPADERRQVTVLFADLSGYTAVSERMDPESVKALVEGALRRLGEEVTRYGGSVDKYIGDNVMAVFGAPVAHEDDEERAVRAALGMQAAMEEINAELTRRHDASFQLRVGINTGEVLAGAVGDGYTVIGDTVNVAARLQAAGRPGSVTVGERTYRATSDEVEYRELDPLHLKGKAQPVPAWEAIGLVAAQPTRRIRARAATPLVGRDDELSLMESLYGRVTRERRPHLVTLVGQAGVGKSRLLHEFRQRFEQLAEEAPAFREGRCLPYGSGVVYWALGEVIRADAGIRDEDSAEQAWEKIKDYACDLLLREEEEREAVERRAALVARLLGIEVPDEADTFPVEMEDPQKLREAFFSAVRAAMEARTGQQPLVLAFEDIHWADHGMLDLIEYLAQWVRGPLLILCLARDELLEHRPSWGGGRRGATSIFLDPLTADETRELVTALLPEGADVEKAANAVATRAGGNPFFAEEMARMLAEEGTIETAELPGTVQALLAARLDSLEPHERQLVQQASVVGRTFWEGSLSAVASDAGFDLQEALMSLQEKDLVVPSMGSQLAGEQEYAFKHVLIRDVAYAMLPKTVRSAKHFEVGRFIEGRMGDRTDEVVTVLAEHYGRAAMLAEESGLPDLELQPLHRKALHFLEAAGDAAALLYSNPEAFKHYKAAREIRCAHDPATLSRINEKQGDVALRMGRVDAAIEVWEECLEFHRSQEDLRRMGDLHRKIGAALWHKGERKQALDHYQKGTNLLKDGPPCLELVRLYEEAAWLYMHAGDNMLAIYASEKALRLAERLGETRAASRAHGIFGRVFGRIGDSAKARENLERSVELARGSDEGETIRALLALGNHLEISDADYDGAGASYTEALTISQRVGDLPAQVELHAALATLAVYRADWDAVEVFTEDSAELAEREGLVGKLCLPYASRGLLRWRSGDWDGAESAFRRAAELADQVGWSEVSFSALLGLATVLRDRGEYGDAETVLAQALDVCERAGLIAQSIQAMSSRALILALGGRMEQARDAATEAADLADRLHYPVGGAAALEAQGATDEGLDHGNELLEQAADAWSAIGRPLDAARCRLALGKRLAKHDDPRARDVLEGIAAELAELGVAHLAAVATQTLEAAAK
jgi:class 3 adenylate cyclase/tetratricopeptide (TPR) repeat protein